MIENPRYVGALAEAGARACVVKTSSAEHLIAVVRAAVLDPGGEHVVVGMPFSMLEGGRGGGRWRPLGQEARGPAAGRGLSNRQIASAPHVAEGTVKRHLANVFERMGVGSRVAAAREALVRDWSAIEEIRASAPGKVEPF